MPMADGGFFPDDNVIRWKDCPECSGRGWMLISERAFRPNLSIADMRQCERCKAEYEKQKALARVEVAEWVGYYFGLQRAYNAAPAGRDFQTFLEIEMSHALSKMPPGTVEAWPRTAILEVEADG